MCPRPPRQAAASSRQLVNDTAVPRQGPREPVSNGIGQDENLVYSILLVVGGCRQPCRQDNRMLPGVSITNSQTPRTKPDPLGPIASQAHNKASSYFAVRAIHSFAEKLAVLTKVVRHGGQSLGEHVSTRTHTVPQWSADGSLKTCLLRRPDDLTRQISASEYMAGRRQRRWSRSRGH